MNAEQANLLRRCRQEHAWRDAAAILTHPLRASAYRVMRRATRRISPRAEKRIEPGRPPEFTFEPRAIFARQPGACEGVRLDGLVAEVERQANGEFRLAGARIARVTPGAGTAWSDPEDGHAWHRLYWAVRYARAAAFGRAEAADWFERDWNLWRGAIKHPDSFAHSAYTMSERIASVAEVLYWLPTKALGRVAPSLKLQAWEDACRLAEHLEYGLGVHNHLLNNARALYIASKATPEAVEAAMWRVTAFKIWDECFPALILPDGAFAEQSSHYHLLLCRTALEYMLACRACGHPAPEGFEERVRSMFRLANDLLRTDGSLPRFGDNSPDHTVRDLWGLMAAGRHHGFLEEAPHHRAITPLTIYYCGTVPRLQTLSVVAPQLRVYSDGGFAFLRSPRHRADVAVHADPRPAMRAHGDAGRGSFELCCDGEAVIRESGSFLRPGDEKSELSRSAGAQNITCLNGLAAVPRADGWPLPAWYWPQSKSEIAVRENGIFVRCYGFRRLYPDLLLERFWTLDDDLGVVMEEHIGGTPPEPVWFESRLWLGDGDPGRLHADGRVAWFDWKGRRDPVRLSVELPEGVRASVETGVVFPEYGMEQSAHVLVLRGKVRPPVDWRLSAIAAAARIAPPHRIAPAWA